MSQLKSGALLSYVSLFITLTISLVYTPIMIRLIGQSEYGLYSLIGSLAAYFSIMDLGLGNTIIRYISRNRVVGNRKIESELNGFFLKIYSLIGILAAIVGFLIWLNIDLIFGSSLSPREIDKAKLMVIILIFNFSLSFPLSLFSSILQAYEKFVVLKLVGICRSLIIPILTLPILLMGYGAVVMLVITTVVNISVLLYQVWYAVNKLDIRFRFVKVDTSFIKEIIGFSFFIFLNVIVDMIYWNTDQFILGITSGTEVVAIYAIAMQFIVIYKLFSTSISNLFLPKASRLVANNASNTVLTSLMLRYGRVQFLILSFTLSGFILFGFPFINIWAGYSYEDAYYIVLIIMIPLTIPLTQNFGIAVLQAKNEQAFRAVTYIIIAVINIVISIPLAIKYGGVGIAIATALSLILGHITIMNIYYHVKIGINMIIFWKNISNLFLVVCLITVIGFGIDKFVITSDNIVWIIIKIIIYSNIFFICIWRYGMNNYEKNLIKSICFNIKRFVLSNL